MTTPHQRHLVELKNRRSAVLSAATALAERASHATRPLTADEHRNYTQLCADLDHLDSRIRVIELEVRRDAEHEQLDRHPRRTETARVHRGAVQRWAGAEDTSYSAAPNSGERSTLNLLRQP
jgi:hypothetical protein